MERILSKEEISELLSAVKQGEVETEREPIVQGGAASAVSRMDLVRLPGPGQWKIPNLDIILDAFARNYAASLTNRLQRSVTVQSSGIESLQFEPALMKVTPYGAIGILNLDPLKAGGLLIFDEKLAFVLLELQLGGSSDGKVKTLTRTMTTIETNILRIIMKDSCVDLQKAFDPVEKIHAKLLKVENNPRLVNIVAPEAGALVAGFKVEIEEFSGMATLVLPHVSLEPLRERLRDTTMTLSSQRNESWPDMLQKGIGLVRTTMAGQIAEVNLRLRDILNFQVGDVVELGCPQTALVKVLVEGQHKFNGLVGVRNGSKAVRIKEVITEGADHGYN